MCVCVRVRACVSSQYALLRAQFDGSPNAHVLMLSQLLVLFYKEEKDHSRLVRHSAGDVSTYMYMYTGIVLVVRYYWVISSPVNQAYM